MKTFRALFNDAMARAIVSGRKTVTRRPMKVQPAGVEWWLHGAPSSPGIGFPSFRDASGGGWLMCGPFLPPASPGDILIGRECWCPRSGGSLIIDKLRTSQFYRATDGVGDMKKPSAWPWRPSIHMPDWAARIRRRVVSVTVERVQDITEEDAVREGIRRWTKDGSVYKYGHIEPGDIGCTPWVDMARTGRDAFARLWDSIYAAKGLGWDVNPWVWRIEFASENEPAA